MSADMQAEDMRARILDMAESLLRRYGLEKLTVMDVARALDMSHGNLYRYFPSKVALRASVIERWLDRVSLQTNAIARQATPADERLEAWLIGLALIKQHKVSEDGEMLAAAASVVKDSAQVEREHSLHMTSQVSKILQDGIKDGIFSAETDPGLTATAILNATYRYHHPVMVASGGPPDIQLAALKDVISLIMAGLRQANQ